jgi:hypothetical protein
MARPLFPNLKLVGHCQLSYRIKYGGLKGEQISKIHTVKKFDEVVRHLHLVTQDQFSLVSKKVFGIPADNFTINIKLF